MDIQLILQSPENHYRSFMAEIPDSEILARDIVAFSNIKGGEIVIGVDKSKNSITGIDVHNDFEKIVSYASTILCKPVISPIVQFYTIRNKVVCLIEVPNGANKPYYIENKKDYPEIYVRSGNKTILADSRLQKELKRHGKNIAVDRLIMKSLSYEDLDKQLIKHYICSIKRESTYVDESSLETIGILAREENKYFPTVGGVLLFMKEPEKSQKLQQAVIKCARFQGKTIGDIKDQAVIKGPLPEQINKAVIFISNYITGVNLPEGPNSPLNAIKEGIVNAVIHRDYYCADTMAISMAIFDDRIEIRSPGVLPSGMTLDQLGKKQVSRNPFISKVLFEKGYFLQWGGGIKRMRDDLNSAGFIPPEFTELEKKFKTTIYFISKKKEHEEKDFAIEALEELIKEEKAKDGIEPVKNYNKRQMKAIRIIEKKGKMTNKDYRFTLKVSNKTAYIELNELLRDRLIVKKGAGRNTCYKMPNHT